MSIHANPEAERRAQERIEARLAAGQERILRREIRGAFSDAADSYRAGRSIDAAIAAHDRRIERALVDMYSAAYETIGQRTARQIAEATGKAWSSSETKQMSDAFRRGLQRFVVRWAARKVTQISSTSRSTVRRITQAAVEQGLTLDDISAEIMQAGIRESVYRAHLIARTEIHSAAQAGSLQAAAESGAVRHKEWISVDDGRTRDGDNTDYDHTKVLPVPVNEPFDVSGEKLMYPGDMSGSAGNVIMCRCAMTYTTR